MMLEETKKRPSPFLDYVHILNSRAPLNNIEKLSYQFSRDTLDRRNTSPPFKFESMCKLLRQMKTIWKELQDQCKNIVAT